MRGAVQRRPASLLGLALIAAMLTAAWPAAAADVGCAGCCCAVESDCPEAPRVERVDCCAPSSPPATPAKEHKASPSSQDSKRSIEGSIAEIPRPDVCTAPAASPSVTVDVAHHVPLYALHAAFLI